MNMDNTTDHRHYMQYYYPNYVAPPTVPQQYIINGGSANMNIQTTANEPSRTHLYEVYVVDSRVKDDGDATGIVHVRAKNPEEARTKVLLRGAYNEDDLEHLDISAQQRIYDVKDVVSDS